MFCPKCGANNSVDAGFCDRSWLKSVISVVAVIVMIAITVLSLNGCGGSGSASHSSSNENAESSINGDSERPVEVTVKSSLDDYTWDELSGISEEISKEATEEGAIEIAKKYNLVGSDGALNKTQAKTIELSDGTTAAVQIAGFLHDDKTSGDKAGITFIFKDAIGKQKMNEDYDNSGGWKDSLVRSWLAKDGLSLLPQDLRNKIVAVKKETNNAGETQSVSSVTTTTDKLWLFSLTELCGTEPAGALDWANGDTYNSILNAEGSEYKLFRDCNVKARESNKVLIKSFDGSEVDWWSRSPFPNSTNCFGGVGTSGDPGYSYAAKYSYGVVPGFCI